MNQTPEHCWILLGAQRGSLLLAKKVQMTTGLPTEVEFDADWVIEQEENPKHDQQRVVGFLHTHPSGSLALSKRDIATMQAWTSCLGKPLYCLIACDKEVAAYRFDDDESAGVKVGNCELFSDEHVVIHDPQHQES